jgi:hypothetical protein
MTSHDPAGSQTSAAKPGTDPSNKTAVNQIFTLQILYTAFEYFAFSMLLVHFKRHFSFEEILIGYALFFFAPLPLIFFARRIRTRAFLALGFVLRGACVVIFAVRPTLPLMLVYYFVTGFIIFLFWVPYNIRYFILSHSANRATLAGHLVVVGPILNTFIPITSGLVIARLGIPYLMAGGVALAALMTYKAWRLPLLDFEYGFRDVMRRAHGLRFLKFVQGVWESGNMVIPLYGLTFLRTELEFGAYLSYLGLVGVIGALIVTRISDRQARRLKYFFPFVIALAFLTMSLAAARTLGQWAVLSGLVGVASTMTYPFLFAVVLDRIKDKAGAMIAREFMLNAGRVAGYLAILLITALTGSMVWGFLFTGLSLLTYPVLLVARKLYMEEDYNPLLPVRKLYEEGRNLVSFGSLKDR